MRVRRRLVRAWLVAAGAVLGATFAGATSAGATSTDSLSSAPAGPIGPQQFGWEELLRAEEGLEFAAGQARQTLARTFLQSGSETVHAGDSLLVRNQDYGIDYVRGVLFLLVPPAAPVRLRIRYLYLPAPHERSFHAALITTREAALAAAGVPPGAGTAPPAPAAASGSVPPAATVPRAGAEPSTPGNLRLSGSNSVGVRFGRNREASLDQSLHVEASGEIGEGLHVNAVLADDNLPVTAEGSTEELGDLSKVFIEMQGPVVGGVLGDYTLERPPGEFVALRRELRGGELRLQSGAHRLSVGAGLPKGELVTANFLGTEGKQGPYELLSARRVAFTTIVPGSERVYLDGLLLRRGENQDYVVDFDRGELRFTSRRRITADSEIAVEFQVNGGGYRRQSRDAQLEGTGLGLRWSGVAFAEGDDRDRPLDTTLDAADQAALAAAGDQTVIVEGIRAVAPGEGLYRHSAADSSIIVYDPVAGDLEVDFYEAGTGQGAYDDSLDVLTGRRIYRYVGDGAGEFDIGRKLAPPGWMQLVSARVDGAPWQGVRLFGEASVSDFDANRFSALDDDDNRGEAIDFKLEAGRAPNAAGGGLGAQVHFSQLSARFHPPGRVRTPYYYKNWNAEGDSLRSTERIAEAALGWGAGGARPWMRLDGMVGRLDRGVELVTDRAQLDWVLGRDAERTIDLHLQALDSEREVAGPEAGRSRRFLQGGARYRLGRLVPALRFEADEFVRDGADSLLRPSYRYVDWSGRLALLETARTSAALSAGRRDTDSRSTAVEQSAGAAEWIPARRNDTVALELTTRPVPALGGELTLSRRTNQPQGAGSETRSDLARAGLSWQPRRHAIRAEWRFELSDEVVRTLQEVLVLAPDGKGDYDAEGRPAGKDLGEYDKVIRYAADATPVRQAESSLRFELGGMSRVGAPGEGPPASWWRRNLGFMQLLALKEQTEGGRAMDLLWLRPGVLDQPGTLFGNFKARQEWSFLNASTRGSLKLLLEWQEGVDGRLTDNAIRDRDRKGTLRGEWSGARRLTYGVEAGLGQRERSGRLDAALPGRPATGTYDVQSERLLGRAAYRISASERFGVDADVTRQRDALSSTQQQLYTVSPSLTLAPIRNLRLLATLAATRVVEEKSGDGVVPYFFDPPGTKLTTSFLGSYRLAQALHFDVTYTGVRATDSRFQYDIKMETRALF